MIQLFVRNYLQRTKKINKRHVKYLYAYDIVINKLFEIIFTQNPTNRVLSKVHKVHKHFKSYN